MIEQVNLFSVLLISFAGMLTVTTLFWAIPWAFKNAALFGLHGLRDRLYRAARVFPQARETTLYRDAEFALTYQIHSVRDRSYAEQVQFFARVYGSRKRRRSRINRTAIYRREMDTVFSSAAGVIALREIEDATSEVGAFVFLRLCTGHPAALLIVLATIFIAIPVIFGIRLARSMQPSEAPGTFAAAAVAHAVVRPGSGLAGAQA